MEIKTIEKNYKFECCKEELKTLCRKLVQSNYHLTAKIVFDHIANTGVEVDMNPALKNQIEFEDFIAD